MIYAHEQREKKAKYLGPRPGFPKVDNSYLPEMQEYLESRHLDHTLAALLNGWYPAFYKGAPRIVIPCSNSAGVPYFQARDMSGKAKLRYASPAASRDDSVVLVWPSTQTQRRGMVVVEGPMDALAAAGIGFLGAAVMGNQPNDEVIMHLAVCARLFSPVKILPDADALQLGPVVLCGLAQRGIDGAVIAPEKKDLAEMLPKERQRLLCR